MLQRSFGTLSRIYPFPFTDFFRDPHFFKTLREKIVPYLQTFPFLKVWIAGCATGEEAYSIAMLLFEENLLERTHIYCTDVNPSVLAKAEQGSYAFSKIQRGSANYAQAGGGQPWLDYFTVQGTTGMVCPEIKNALTFSKHNLIGDTVFGEMHLILCRNVLIYFTPDLQNQVLTLLTKSLPKRGCLCLSPNETLQGSSVATAYDGSSSQFGIYRLRI